MKAWSWKKSLEVGYKKSGCGIVTWNFIGVLVLSSSGYAVFVLLDSVVRLVVS